MILVKIIAVIWLGMLGTIMTVGLIIYMIRYNEMTNRLADALDRSDTRSSLLTGEFYSKVKEHTS